MNKFQAEPSVRFRVSEALGSKNLNQHNYFLNIVSVIFATIFHQMDSMVSKKFNVCWTQTQDFSVQFSITHGTFPFQGTSKIFRVVDWIKCHLQPVVLLTNIYFWGLLGLRIMFLKHQKLWLYRNYSAFKITNSGWLVARWLQHPTTSSSTGGMDSGTWLTGSIETSQLGRNWHATIRVVT